MRHGQSQKVISFLTLFFYLSTNIVTADLAVSDFAISSQDQKIKPQQFIPAELGEISKRYDGAGDRLIVLLQDAHANEEAQKNIASILGHLHRNEKIRTVQVEGASGYLNLSFISAYPDKQALAALADELLKIAEWSAVEYAGGYQIPEIRIHGVEDEKLYEENRAAFLTALDRRKEDEQILAGIEKSLDAAAKRVLGREHQALLVKGREYRKDGKRFLEYFHFLTALADARKIDLSVYTQLSRFMELESVQDAIDEEMLRREISSIKEKLGWKSEKGKEESDWEEVLAAAEKSGIDLSGMTQCAAWRKAAGLKSRLSVAIFEEIDDLESAARQVIAVSAAEKQIDRLYRILETYQKFVRFSLTRDDVDYYIANKNDFTVSYLKAGIGTLPEGAEILDSDLTVIQKFYDLALRRDQVMIEATLKQMSDSGETKSVLLAGGFHTAGFERELEARKISYITVRPSIKDAFDAEEQSKLYEASMKEEDARFADWLVSQVSRSEGSQLNDPGFQLAQKRRAIAQGEYEAARSLWSGGRDWAKTAFDMRGFRATLDHASRLVLLDMALHPQTFQSSSRREGILAGSTGFDRAVREALYAPFLPAGYDARIYGLNEEIRVVYEKQDGSKAAAPLLIEIEPARPTSETYRYQDTSLRRKGALVHQFGGWRMVSQQADPAEIAVAISRAAALNRQVSMAASLGMESLPDNAAKKALLALEAKMRAGMDRYADFAGTADASDSRRTRTRLASLRRNFTEAAELVRAAKGYKSHRKDIELILQAIERPLFDREVDELIQRTNEARQSLLALAPHLRAADADMQEDHLKTLRTFPGRIDRLGDYYDEFVVEGLRRLTQQRQRNRQPELREHIEYQITRLTALRNEHNAHALFTSVTHLRRFAGAVNNHSASAIAVSAAIQQQNPGREDYQTARQAFTEWSTAVEIAREEIAEIGDPVIREYAVRTATETNLPDGSNLQALGTILERLDDAWTRLDDLARRIGDDAQIADEPARAAIGTDLTVLRDQVGRRSEGDLSPVVGELETMIHQATDIPQGIAEFLLAVLAAQRNTRTELRNLFNQRVSDHLRGIRERAEAERLAAAQIDAEVRDALRASRDRLIANTDPAELGGILTDLYSQRDKLPAETPVVTGIDATALRQAVPGLPATPEPPVDRAVVTGDRMKKDVSGLVQKIADKEESDAVEVRSSWVIIRAVSKIGSWMIKIWKGSEPIATIETAHQVAEKELGSGFRLATIPLGTEVALGETASTKWTVAPGSPVYVQRRGAMTVGDLIRNIHASDAPEKNNLIREVVGQWIDLHHAEHLGQGRIAAPAIDLDTKFQNDVVILEADGRFHLRSVDHEDLVGLNTTGRLTEKEFYRFFHYFWFGQAHALRAIDPAYEQMFRDILSEKGLLPQAFLDDAGAWNALYDAFHENYQFAPLRVRARHATKLSPAERIQVYQASLASDRAKGLLRTHGIQSWVEGQVRTRQEALRGSNTTAARLGYLVQEVRTKQEYFSVRASIQNAATLQQFLDADTDLRLLEESLPERHYLRPQLGEMRNLLDVGLTKFLLDKGNAHLEHLGRLLRSAKHVDEFSGIALEFRHFEGVIAALRARFTTPKKLKVDARLAELQNRAHDGAMLAQVRAELPELNTGVETLWRMLHDAVTLGDAQAVLAQAVSLEERVRGLAEDSAQRGKLLGPHVKQLGLIKEGAALLGVVVDLGEQLARASAETSSQPLRDISDPIKVAAQDANDYHHHLTGVRDQLPRHAFRFAGEMKKKADQLGRDYLEQAEAVNVRIYTARLDEFEQALAPIEEMRNPVRLATRLDDVRGLLQLLEEQRELIRTRTPNHPELERRLDRILQRAKVQEQRIRGTQEKIEGQLRGLRAEILDMMLPELGIVIDAEEGAALDPQSLNFRIARTRERIGTDHPLYSDAVTELETLLAMRTDYVLLSRRLAAVDPNADVAVIGNVLQDLDEIEALLAAWRDRTNAYPPFQETARLALDRVGAHRTELTRRSLEAEIPPLEARIGEQGTSAALDALVRRVPEGIAFAAVASRARHLSNMSWVREQITVLSKLPDDQVLSFDFAPLRARMTDVRAHGPYTRDIAGQISALSELIEMLSIESESARVMIGFTDPVRALIDQIGYPSAVDVATAAGEQSPALLHYADALSRQDIEHTRHQLRGSQPESLTSRFRAVTLVTGKRRDRIQEILGWGRALNDFTRRVYNLKAEIAKAKTRKEMEAAREKLQVLGQPETLRAIYAEVNKANPTEVAQILRELQAAYVGGLGIRIRDTLAYYAERRAEVERKIGDLEARMPKLLAKYSALPDDQFEQKTTALSRMLATLGAQRQQFVAMTAHSLGQEDPPKDPERSLEDMQDILRQARKERKQQQAQKAKGEDLGKIQQVRSTIKRIRIHAGKVGGVLIKFKEKHQNNNVLISVISALRGNRQQLQVYLEDKTLLERARRSLSPKDRKELYRQMNDALAYVENKLFLVIEQLLETLDEEQAVLSHPDYDALEADLTRYSQLMDQVKADGRGPQWQALKARVTAAAGRITAQRARIGDAATQTTGTSTTGGNTVTGTATVTQTSTVTSGTATRSTGTTSRGTSGGGVTATWNNLSPAAKKGISIGAIATVVGTAALVWMLSGKPDEEPVAEAPDPGDAPVAPAEPPKAPEAKPAEKEPVKEPEVEPLPPLPPIRAEAEPDDLHKKGLEKEMQIEEAREWNKVKAARADFIERGRLEVDLQIPVRKRWDRPALERQLAADNAEIAKLKGEADRDPEARTRMLFLEDRVRTLQNTLDTIGRWDTHFAKQGMDTTVDIMISGLRSQLQKKLETQFEIDYVKSRLAAAETEAKGLEDRANAEELKKRIDAGGEDGTKARLEKTRLLERAEMIRRRIPSFRRHIESLTPVAEAAAAEIARIERREDIEIEVLDTLDRDKVAPGDRARTRRTLLDSALELEEIRALDRIAAAKKDTPEGAEAAARAAKMREARDNRERAGEAATAYRTEMEAVRKDFWDGVAKGTYKEDEWHYFRRDREKQYEIKRLEEGKDNPPDRADRIVRYKKDRESNWANWMDYRIRVETDRKIEEKRIERKVDTLDFAARRQVVLEIEAEVLRAFKVELEKRKDDAVAADVIRRIDQRLAELAPRLEEAADYADFRRRVEEHRGKADFEMKRLELTKEYYERQIEKVNAAKPAEAAAIEANRRKLEALQKDLRQTEDSIIRLRERRDYSARILAVNRAYDRGKEDAAIDAVARGVAPDRLMDDPAYVDELWRLSRERAFDLRIATLEHEIEVKTERSKRSPDPELDREISALHSKIRILRFNKRWEDEERTRLVPLKADEAKARTALFGAGGLYDQLDTLEMQRPRTEGEKLAKERELLKQVDDAKRWLRDIQAEARRTKMSPETLDMWTRQAEARIRKLNTMLADLQKAPLKGEVPTREWEKREADLNTKVKAAWKALRDARDAMADLKLVIEEERIRDAGRLLDLGLLTREEYLEILGIRAPAVLPVYEDRPEVTLPLTQARDVALPQDVLPVAPDSGWVWTAEERAIIEGDGKKQGILDNLNMNPLRGGEIQDRYERGKTYGPEHWGHYPLARILRDRNALNDPVKRLATLKLMNRAIEAVKQDLAVLGIMDDAELERYRAVRGAGFFPPDHLALLEQTWEEIAEKEFRKSANVGRRRPVQTRVSFATLMGLVEERMNKLQLDEMENELFIAREKELIRTIRNNPLVYMQMMYKLRVGQLKAQFAYEVSLAGGVRTPNGVMAVQKFQTNLQLADAAVANAVQQIQAGKDIYALKLANGLGYGTFEAFVTEINIRATNAHKVNPYLDVVFMRTAGRKGLMSFETEWELRQMLERKPPYDRNRSGFEVLAWYMGQDILREADIPALAQQEARAILLGIDGLAGTLSTLDVTQPYANEMAKLKGSGSSAAVRIEQAYQDLILKAVRHSLLNNKGFQDMSNRFVREIKFRIEERKKAGGVHAKYYEWNDGVVEEMATGFMQHMILNGQDPKDFDQRSALLNDFFQLYENGGLAAAKRVLGINLGRLGDDPTSGDRWMLGFLNGNEQHWKWDDLQTMKAIARDRANMGAFPPEDVLHLKILLDLIDETEAVTDETAARQDRRKAAIAYLQRISPSAAGLVAGRLNQLSNPADAEALLTQFYSPLLDGRTGLRITSQLRNDDELFLAFRARRDKLYEMLRQKLHDIVIRDMRNSILAMREKSRNEGRPLITDGVRDGRPVMSALTIVQWEVDFHTALSFVVFGPDENTIGPGKTARPRRQLDLLNNPKDRALISRTVAELEARGIPKDTWLDVLAIAAGRVNGNWQFTDEGKLDFPFHRTTWRLHQLLRQAPQEYPKDGWASKMKTRRDRDEFVGILIAEAEKLRLDGFRAYLRDYTILTDALERDVKKPVKTDRDLDRTMLRVHEHVVALRNVFREPDAKPLKTKEPKSYSDLTSMEQSMVRAILDAAYQPGGNLEEELRRLDALTRVAKTEEGKRYLRESLAGTVPFYRAILPPEAVHALPAEITANTVLATNQSFSLWRGKIMMAVDPRLDLDNPKTVLEAMKRWDRDAARLRTHFEQFPADRDTLLAVAFEHTLASRGRALRHQYVAPVDPMDASQRGKYEPAGLLPEDRADFERTLKEFRGNSRKRFTEEPPDQILFEEFQAQLANRRQHLGVYVAHLREFLAALPGAPVRPAVIAPLAVRSVFDDVTDAKRLDEADLEEFNKLWAAGRTLPARRTDRLLQSPGLEPSDVQQLFWKTHRTATAHPGQAITITGLLSKHDRGVMEALKFRDAKRGYVEKRIVPSDLVSDTKLKRQPPIAASNLRKITEFLAQKKQKLATNPTGFKWEQVPGEGEPSVRLEMRGQDAVLAVSGLAGYPLGPEILLGSAGESGDHYKAMRVHTSTVKVDDKGRLTVMALLDGKNYYGVILVEAGMDAEGKVLTADIRTDFRLKEGAVVEPELRGPAIGFRSATANHPSLIIHKRDGKDETIDVSTRPEKEETIGARANDVHGYRIKGADNRTSYIVELLPVTGQKYETRLERKGDQYSIRTDGAANGEKRIQFHYRVTALPAGKEGAAMVAPAGWPRAEAPGDRGRAAEDIRNARAKINYLQAENHNESLILAQMFYETLYGKEAFEKGTRPNLVREFGVPDDVAPENRAKVLRDKQEALRKNPTAEALVRSTLERVTELITVERPTPAEYRTALDQFRRNVTKMDEVLKQDEKRNAIYTLAILRRQTLGNDFALFDAGLADPAKLRELLDEAAKGRKINFFGDVVPADPKEKRAAVDAAIADVQRWIRGEFKDEAERRQMEILEPIIFGFGAEAVGESGRAGDEEWQNFIIRTIRNLLSLHDLRGEREARADFQRLLDQIQGELAVQEVIQLAGEMGRYAAARHEREERAAVEAENIQGPSISAFAENSDRIWDFRDRVREDLRVEVSVAIPVMDDSGKTGLVASHMPRILSSEPLPHGVNLLITNVSHEVPSTADQVVLNIAGINTYSQLMGAYRSAIREHSLKSAEIVASSLGSAWSDESIRERFLAAVDSKTEFERTVAFQHLVAEITGFRTLPASLDSRGALQGTVRHSASEPGLYVIKGYENLKADQVRRILDYLPANQYVAVALDPKALKAETIASLKAALAELGSRVIVQEGTVDEATVQTAAKLEMKGITKDDVVQFAAESGVIKKPEYLQAALLTGVPYVAGRIVIFGDEESYSFDVKRRVSITLDEMIRAWTAAAEAAKRIALSA